MSEHSPTVSVIIPTYNSAKYLRKALESVFSQTYKNFEVIVVDDGSTDETSIVVEKYVNSICYIKKENGGQSSARNMGIEQSNGEFVAFLDADDECEPFRLERQVAYLLENREVGFIGSFANRINAYGKKIGVIEAPQSMLEVRWFSMFKNSFILSSILARRDILEQHKIRFASSFSPAEDYDFWNRFLEISDGVNLRETLVNYRTHNQSLSSIKQYVQIDNHIKIASRTIRRFLNCQNLSDDRMRQLILLAGNLESQDRAKIPRAELVENYLDIWEMFAMKHSNASDILSLKKQVVAKAARMVLVTPFARGTKNIYIRLNALDGAWMIAFLASLPSRLLAKASSIYSNHLRKT